MISVEKVDERRFKVSVAGNGDRTTHEVTLEPEYHRRLTGGRITPEELIEKSFEFLLEREPASSILRRFDLPVIGRYFPEYEQVIRERVA